MSTSGKSPSPRGARAVLRVLSAGLLLAALSSPPAALSQSQIPSDAQLTLEQFRALLRKQQPAPSGRKPLPPPDLRPAERVFSQLLIAQAKEAAARQSVDRLSGWNKAIQARFQAQSAPALDVEMIRFAEAKAAAESAQFETERRRAARQANSLLGRPADSPLVALLSAAAARQPEGSASAAGLSPLEKLEKELLPQGQELLAKLYQSYQFGGIPLSALLWQEQEVYKTELQYRVWMARAAADSSAAWPQP